MPLKGSIGSRIREFHKGATYARTKSKFGKERADAQAIAVAYKSKARRRRKRG
jgi:hypothetical protein